MSNDQKIPVVDINLEGTGDTSDYLVGENRLEQVSPGLMCRIDNTRVRRAFIMRSTMPKPQLMLQFRLGSPSDVQYPQQKRHFRLAPHFALIAMAPGENKREIFIENQLDYVVSLHCKPELIRRHLESTQEVRPQWLDNFLNNKGLSLFRSYTLTQDMRSSASKILELNPSGQFYKLSLEILTLELLLQSLRCILTSDATDTPVAGMSTRDSKNIHAAKQQLDQSFPHFPALSELSEQLKMSDWKFNRCFKAAFNVSASEYMVKLRMTLAKKLLISTELSITDIGVEVGYGYTANFSKAFKNQVGMSPKLYRNTHDNP